MFYNEGENYNPNNDSPISSKMTPDLTKNNIYLKGGNNIGEALRFDRSDLILKMENSNSIAVRMKLQRENALKNNGFQTQKQDEESNLYSANPFSGLANNQNNG